MLRKPFRTIKRDNGQIDIYGNNQPRELDYDHTPEWSEEEEASFMYKGQRYFLSEFMRTRAHGLPYDGYLNDSYFSGILIKLSEDGETVTVHTFIAH